LGTERVDEFPASGPLAGNFVIFRRIWQGISARRCWIVRLDQQARLMFGRETMHGQHLTRNRQPVNHRRREGVGGKLRASRQNESGVTK